ncbi:MAG: hypothetical protein IT536_11150 [Hyphomicrobiales bacterium]|nr:hypothetical protein [Hyphomicrobiales bacterium]
MYGLRIALPLCLAIACAAAAPRVVPRGIEAATLLAAQDDPVRLTEHALDRSFNAELAHREIEAALAAKDADLAQSFLDLARDRGVAVDPALAERVAAANSAAAAAARAAGSFAQGLITGSPEDVAGLAGTALGDLFVFGDIRDAVREGSRLAQGEAADELLLGLAGVGIALTAGTYVSLGAGMPARVGVSVLKAARKTGRLTAQMGQYLNRTLREIVDWPALRRAVGQARITEPATTARAVRETVRMDKSRDLVRMVSDLGRVQNRAGTQAALDGLRLAQGPRDVARLARLADAKGSRTRAILKMFGRGALFLAVGAVQLTWWVFGAVLTVLGFVAALKRAVERATERYCRWRRLRRARALERCSASAAGPYLRS